MDFFDIKLLATYQNEEFLVINKPNNLAVQKNKDYSDSLEEILEKDNSLFSALPRCGIVHRLDRQTTGILIVAKNFSMFAFLTALFKTRKIKKIYLALLRGNITSDSGEIRFYIEKDFTNNQFRMKLNSQKGKLVNMTFQVIERLANFTLVEIYPLTGRTHQIRLACQKINYPIYNDPVYSSICKNKEIGQYLHAYSLEFIDNQNQKKYFSVALPEFFINKLKILGSKKWQKYCEII